MQISELQTQIDQAQTTIKRLHKTAEAPSGDFDADLATETQLASAERLLARLETQLSERVAADEADREKRVRSSAEARLSELEAIYRGECAELAAVIDDAAQKLEPTLSAVIAKRGELAELNNEFVRLYKQLTGERPDVLQRPWRSGLVPGEFSPLPEPSPLYDHTALALYAAVSEHESGPYSLQMILAAVSGAQRPRDADNPQVPTPKAATDENPSPMQAFARGRRPNFD